MGVRQEGGFDALEGWSIKEISQGATCPRNFPLACSSSCQRSKSPSKILSLLRRITRSEILICLALSARP